MSSETNASMKKRRPFPDSLKNLSAVPLVFGPHSEYTVKVGSLCVASGNSRRGAAHHDLKSSRSFSIPQGFYKPHEPSREIKVEPSVPLDAE